MFSKTIYVVNYLPAFMAMYNKTVKKFTMSADIVCDLYLILI